MSTLELLGLCDLVIILILIVLSFLEVLFLFLLTFYRLCKGSSNMVDNIATEKSESQEDTRSYGEINIKNAQQYAYNVRAPAPQVEELDEVYYRGTNKQEHMKKFRNNHFQTINNGFGADSRIKSVRDLKNSTFNSNKGGTGSKYYHGS